MATVTIDLKRGSHVKFKLKPGAMAHGFGEPVADEHVAKLHKTADDFHYGIYFPAHKSRSPEVKHDGVIVKAAETVELPEHVCPMKPTGENLMLPNFKTEKFERVIFTPDQLDLSTLHECDHLDHVPPGRKVDPNWKPDKQREAEEAAAKQQATA